MKIWCVECNNKVVGRLTTGREIYGPQSYFKRKRFWICDHCKNYVGCHKSDPRPLGMIANPELRAARQDIHRLLDPIWQDNGVSRTRVYRRLAKLLKKKEYHTANIASLDEAREVWEAIQILIKRINDQQ